MNESSIENQFMRKTILKIQETIQQGGGQVMSL